MARRVLPLLGLLSLSWLAIWLWLPEPASFARADPPLWAALIALAVWVVASCALASQPVLCVCTGALFGAALGAPISVLGALGGNAAAWLITYRFPAAAAALAHRPRVGKLVARLSKQRTFGIATLRAVPGMPGTPMSYAAGIARVPIVPFIVGMTIGGGPKIALYAVAGASLTEPDPTQLTLLACGLFAIAGLAWLAQRRLGSTPAA